MGEAAFTFDDTPHHSRIRKAFRTLLALIVFILIRLVDNLFRDDFLDDIFKGDYADSPSGKTGSPAD